MGERRGIGIYTDVGQDAEDRREQYATANTTEPTTQLSHIFRRSKLLDSNDLSTYTNKMQVDCRAGPDICNQVCWFSNCVAGDEGKLQYPEYTIGYDEMSVGDKAKGEANQNRLKSGVRTSRGPPCQAWPMGQKFWDSYVFPKPKTPPKARKKTTLDSTQYLGWVI